MSRLLKLKEAARQPLFWAKQTHRLSGLVLAFFLPFHFWALSHALAGAGALSRVMRMSENPFYKISEWLLVFLLVFHLAGACASCGWNSLTCRLRSKMLWRGALALACW
ncbi:MAG: succinate dehydrogenase [Betaproteobacteria bacterium]|nr:succinate dehydrogenase [Betaproteobacteria bacterium]